MESQGKEAELAAERNQLVLRVACGVLLLVSGLVLISGIQLVWTCYLHSYGDDSDRDYVLKIDLERAAVAELMLVPGFGEILSLRWIEQREELLRRYPDPLTALSHLPGIGRQKLEAIRPFVIDASAKSGPSELVQSNAQSVEP